MNWNIIRYTVTILSIRIIIGLAFTFLSSHFSFPASNNLFEGLSLAEQVLIIGFITPLFETVIFQFAIIELVTKLKNIPNVHLLAISISSITFSASHFQSYFYMASSLASGLIYAIAYVNIRKIHGQTTTIVSILAVHSLYNLIAFAINYFLY